MRPFLIKKINVGPCSEYFPFNMVYQEENFKTICHTSNLNKYEIKL